MAPVHRRDRADGPNVSDLSLLLSVQAGYDARAPLSMEGNGAAFQGSLEASFQGQADRMGGRLQGLYAL